MSGINSVLDTLLHQVLGKRVDTASPRPLTEPVRPAAPARAVQALRGDSAPQSRASSLEQKVATDVRRENASALPAKSGIAANGSARTHFSTAARTIADLLVRYPAPPSAIRPAAPLLPLSEGGEAEPLATQLRASVERSGLFYESHLGRWFRGGESGEQLSREPQMRLTRAIPLALFKSAAAAPQGAAPANRAQGAFAPATASLVPPSPSGVSGEAVSPESAPSAPAKTLAEHPAGNVEERGSNVRMPVDRAASDTLQGLLRHQLEMLAAPVLRWEGEVWPGVTMAFALLPPEQLLQQGSDEGADGDGDRGNGEDGWQSELTLRLPGLGEIAVRLALCGERLELALGSASEKTAECLERASEPLRERLTALGFEDILLTVEVLREGK
ncbi:flagellar hook-length control protein FliK [Microbulbifer thermotolerans]|uniref:flagellar hook-length control protein FliK n=1 Tax=Microbulbifer thermotolerans TaxID=252514 RepID=UPI0022493F20|nr:flagellar hook-length control protein FliK [Microbulbifer thermotolerans]MCX2780134.1 flagellar hook-length control protein FliK [Microbulbifer thermotolerans]MCX2805558.1 flagellar hook-length control protein FliK [Microbulbifer thermotolerans]MCX2831914.1 flagellar hook-length control protein FliK [Microbulbifer thermotolerans]MCX2842521.1 flagellar hook-length control protein FliK [Microbulbifer thermotolerans]